MIVINEPQIIRHDKIVSISSDLLIGNDQRKLWFRLPRFAVNFLIFENLDAFVVALLPLALKLNYDICIKGSISARLYYNINNYLISALCLSNSEFHKIRIYAEKLSENDFCTYEKAGTGISCGVDSFATFFKHNELEKPFKIEYLTFFNVGSHGDFGGEKARKIYNKRFYYANKFVEAVNLPIINIDSNLSEIIKFKFKNTSTLRNAACILLLQKVFKNYYLASQNRFDYFKLNKSNSQDFDTLLLPLLSTESITIHSAVSNLKRTERTLFISEFPLTYKHLDVCTNPNASNHKNNCSICSKCMRTQLTLDLYGKLNLYEPVFHLEKFFKIRDNYIAQVYNLRNLDPFSADLFELIRQKNELKAKHILLAKYIRLKSTYNFIKRNIKKALIRK